jgi:hypothetical protein
MGVVASQKSVFVYVYKNLAIILLILSGNLGEELFLTENAKISFFVTKCSFRGRDSTVLNNSFIV